MRASFFRSALGAPAFSAAIVLTLALGLGSNTALFSIADGLLFRSLPYENPGRLIVISETQPASRARALVSAPDFLAWKTSSRTIASMAAFRPWGFVLTGSGDAERLSGARVSAELFPLLGVRPILGRTFLPSEDVYGASHVVLVSQRLWQQRLGASQLSERTLVLNGVPHAVVGVMPRDLRLPDADVWVPLALEPFALAQRGTRALTVVGRLAGGATLAQARSEMDAIAADLARRFPDANAGWGADAIPLDEHLVGRIRPTVLLLWGAVGLVLLAACANTAGLMFARAGARRQEIAVRRALGAGRARLVRRLLGESVTLALVAGVAGIPLASALLALLVRLAPPDLPSLGDARIDLRVAAFSVALSIVTGVVFGLLPALRTTHDDLSPLLRGGRSDGAAAPATFRNAAVACQMAIALIVLICAGLLVRSFDRLLSVDVGFDPQRVLTMTVAPGPRYADPTRRAAFFAQLLRDLEAIPGVVSAGFVSHPPLAAPPLTVDVAVEGRAPPTPRSIPSASYSAVGGKWFETMGVPLLRGRGFASSDAAGAPPVVVISENLARLLWPGSDPVGHRLIVGGTIGADTTPREVVGVAGNVRASLESPPPLQIYVPYSQNAWPSMSVAVRTSGDPAQWSRSARAAVSALDPDQAVYNVRPFDQIVSRAVATRRFQMLIVSLFALVALALSFSGVYGIVTYTVRLRTREIGIRMALGAPPPSVLLLAVRDSLIWSVAGIFAGGLVAMGVTRALTGMLYDIRPTDPLTFAMAAAGATAIAACGSALAARRATSIDPLDALRVE
jgi:putative ABC transport system permease protein